MIDFLLKKGDVYIYIYKTVFLMMKIYEWKKSSWHLTLSSNDPVFSMYGESQSHQAVETEFSLFFP